MLDRVKRFIGITDKLQDELITDIINVTERRLLARLGGLKEIPIELEFIVVEVSVKRFNRIGSEGLAKKTVEGLTKEFSADDFEEYEADIAEYLKPEDSGSDRDGVVMFF